MRRASLFSLFDEVPVPSVDNLSQAVRAPGENGPEQQGLLDGEASQGFSLWAPGVHGGHWGGEVWSSLPASSLLGHYHIERGEAQRLTERGALYLDQVYNMVGYSPEARLLFATARTIHSIVLRWIAKYEISVCLSGYLRLYNVFCKSFLQVNTEQSSAQM